MRKSGYRDQTSLRASSQEAPAPEHCTCHKVRSNTHVESHLRQTPVITSRHIVQEH